MNILSKIKSLMTKEEELLPSSAPEQEEQVEELLPSSAPEQEEQVEELLPSSAPEQEEPTEEVELVFQRCGCPENNKFRQDQLGERCMFCGKNFYSIN
jgi:hypothetical protein